MVKSNWGYRKLGKTKAALRSGLCTFYMSNLQRDLERGQKGSVLTPSALLVELLGSGAVGKAVARTKSHL